jgi:hypothetical protein
VRDVFNAASRLQHPAPVLDSPPQTVPAQALLGIFLRAEIDRRRQEPLDRFGVRGRIFLARVNHPDIDRSLVGVIVCRTELDAHKAYRQIRAARGPLGPGLLFAFLRPGALPWEPHTNPALNRRLAYRYARLYATKKETGSTPTSTPHTRNSTPG